MTCAMLQSFLEGDLSPENQAQFEQHLVACSACRDEVEADMQFYALGAQLSQRRDRPRAIVPDPQEQGARREVPRSRAASRRRNLLGGVAVAAAAVIAITLLRPGREEARQRLERQITAQLSPTRAIEGRLPYTPFDRYREYDTPRTGTTWRGPATSREDGTPRATRRDQLSDKTQSELAALPDKTGLVAAYLARGDLVAAEDALLRAGPGDDLDVERALVASMKGQHTDALALLDRVLSRTPHHAQAMWNRAVALTELDLPLVAAEAFEASLAIFEPGWHAEATTRMVKLRAAEYMRTRRWKAASDACRALAEGVLPDLGLVRNHPSVCRPALNEAVRRAQTRDEVMRLLPVADVIDAQSQDTASSELVKRTASADFRIRGPSVALYRKLTMTPDLSTDDKVQLVARLRASRQGDLVLGALQRTGMLPEHADEYVKLAFATRDPYFMEIAVERDAQSKLESGRALEAELSLREAVARCTKRDVELRCAYLQKALANLYVARHRPIEATETALAALQRSRRLNLYWDERLLFTVLAEAARFARDYPAMRAYIREAALRDDECAQRRQSHEVLADVELAELRFANARAELDSAPTCDEPPTLLRAQIEAGLAHVEGTPERIGTLRQDFERLRRNGGLTPGEKAYLDACEGRLVAPGDPTVGRSLLARAIDAADDLGIDDVGGLKARISAYSMLLLLGANDLDGPALLDLFAAAGRVRRPAGCILGALVEGERLLLVARDASGRIKQVFEPHAFKTPDFDARTLVPAELVSALSSCPRIDVIALPPLYGQPHLLPPGLAWSYRGPATAQPPRGLRRQVALTIEDVRPPAALRLPKLPSRSKEQHRPDVDDVVVSGDEATPQRVLKEISLADFIEIHAHGFVDLGISDVSLIALSPQADGTFALTARTIAGVKFERAPFIALAACHAAYTAPYLHEPWSLPYAFLLAGARGVLAPTTAVPDKDAGAFFRAVGDQILRGADPAIVLRDQRLQRRGGAADWVNDVVLFD
jgi:tetratricopeptide (TPR) repeat protein